MSDIKLMKTIMYVATLTGFAISICWIAKKVLMPEAISRTLQSSQLAGSIALKQFLSNQEILDKLKK